MTGYKEAELLQKSWQDIIHPDYLNKSSVKVNRLLENDKDFSHTLQKVLHKNGGVIWVNLNIVIKRDSKNRPLFLIGDIEDITVRKKAEEALRDSEEKFRTIVSNAHAVIFMVDQNGTFLLSEGKGLEALGLKPGQVVGMSAFEIYKDIPKIKNGIKKALAGTFNTKEIKVNDMYFDTFYSPYKNADNKLIGVIGMSIDITERKQAEAKLLKSLQEKEILLKEIHHRVKNNLQIIISLLNLQAARIKDEQTVKAYQESKNRIYSMALVHEKLYQSADFSEIRFKGYIESMIRELFRVYEISGIISLNLHIDDISLGIDKAIPCGLIINEILSNSLKHAFPNDRKGQIDISFVNMQEHIYEFSIKDNGIGIPDKIDIRETNSLGLQLIRILTRQIDGQLTLERNNGTAFKIAFKN